jgi:hypothetical protein
MFIGYLENKELESGITIHYVNDIDGDLFSAIGVNKIVKQQKKLQKKECIRAFAFS